VTFDVCVCGHLEQAHVDDVGPCHSPMCECECFRSEDDVVEELAA
jgi:hypothetical protein